MGKGLSVPLNSFSVCVEKSCITLAVGLASVYFSKINMDENYKLSICSIEKLLTEKASIIKINDVKERVFYGN